MKNPNTVNHNMSARVNRWLDEITPLPERYYFGIPCIHGHAKNGRAVRYKSSNRSCVLCDCFNNRKAKHKKESKTNRSSEALNTYEESLYREEADPLFDEGSE